MPYRDINVTLADKDLQEIKQAIATIQQKLPFSITATRSKAPKPVATEAPAAS